MNIKIHTISIWNLVIAIVATVIFIGFYEQGKSEFRTYQDVTEEYHYCKEAALELQAASDYLTEQVRLYTLTADNEYVDTYFTEVNVTKRREKALDHLQTYFDKTESFRLLQEALKNSQELMQIEYYSMKLVLEGKDYDESQFPLDVQQAELMETDYLLTGEEKILKAQTVVSDEKYQEIKSKIAGDVEGCMEDLLRIMQKREKNSVNIFTNRYKAMAFGIIPLIVLLLGNYIVINRQVARPLGRYNECIKEGKKLPSNGVRELQNLAATYNHVYSENKDTQEQLRYQAGHDALTKLLNRGSFETILRRFEAEEESFALLIVDVDFFKKINDNYGHAVGDDVLKKVGSFLKAEFRSRDYVCRIGGDEFAILLSAISKEQKSVIVERIDSVNKKLQRSEVGIPCVSLSIGIAFSENDKSKEDIFKRADEALYYVKEHGKNGYAFYGMYRGM